MLFGPALELLAPEIGFPVRDPPVTLLGPVLLGSAALGLVVLVLPCPDLC